MGADFRWEPVAHQWIVVSATRYGALAQVIRSSAKRSVALFGAYCAAETSGAVVPLRRRA